MERVFTLRGTTARLPAGHLKHLRKRTKATDPAVSGPAHLSLTRVARFSWQRTSHLRMATVSADMATRLRAAMIVFERGESPLIDQLQAMSALGPAAFEIAPDVAITLIATPQRAADGAEDTRLRTALAGLARSPYWAARARDALAAYHEANGDVAAAAEVLGPALMASGDAPAERQAALLRLARLQGLGAGAEARSAHQHDAGADALLRAMGLEGPLGAIAAKRLASIRTRQRRFEDAERLWVHARELGLQAPDDVCGGWITNYAAVAVDAEGVATWWSRDQPELIPEEGMPEGRAWGPVGGPRDELVRRPFRGRPGGVAVATLMLETPGAQGLAFLLLTRSGHPMQVSERAFDAVREWWELIRRGKAPQSPPIMPIVDSAERSGLRVHLEIELLLLDVARRAGVAIDPQIAAGMGWTKHLMNGVFPLQQMLGDDPKPSPYEARDAFCEIAPGLGSAMMAVLRPEGERPALIDLARLVDALWTIDLEALTAADRASYATLMDRARKAVKSWNRSSDSPSEPTRRGGDTDAASSHPGPALGRAQARAATAIERARREMPTHGMLDRLRNAADAARGLESVAAMTYCPEIIDTETVELITDVATTLPAVPSDHLDAMRASEPELRDGWELNACVNAGDVLRLLASLERAQRPLEHVRDRLVAADRYFKEAGRWLSSDIAKHAMVNRRWSTALTTLADVIADTEPDAAIEQAKQAAVLADVVRNLSSPGARTRAEAALHQLRALTLQRWLEGASEPTSEELEVRHDLSTKASIENLVSWCVSHDRHADAMAVIDDAVAAWPSEALHSWKTYRASAIMADWARQDPDKLKEAIRCAIELVHAQPWNLTAAIDLLALLTDASLWTVTSSLAGLATDASKEANGLSAIVAFRALMPGADPPPPDGLAADLVAIGTGDGDALETFERWDPRRLLRLIPALADALGKHGDRESRPELGHTAARLLCSSLDVRFDMRTWIQAAQLALRLSDGKLATRVGGYLDPERTLIGYVAILAARLELLAGETDAAFDRLADVDARMRRTHGRPDPKILDLQARTAVQLGRIKEADELYRQALALRPMDPGAFFGLGRVARERGDHLGACAAWLSALAIGAEAHGDRWARLVARSIARASADARGADASSVDDLLAVRLAAAPQAAVAALAVGLRDAGRPRPALVEAILELPRRDTAIDNRVGQVLMSALVWEALAPEHVHSLDEVIARAEQLVTWSSKRDVLGQVLAGVKSTYARAYIERVAGGSAAGAELHALGHVARSALRRAHKAEAFLDAVINAPTGDSSYYWRARQAYNRLPNDPEVGLALTLTLISRMAQALTPDNAPVPLLALLGQRMPALTLDQIMTDVSWVDEGPVMPAPTGFFDRTTMLVVEAVQPPRPWTASLEVCERELPEPELLAGFDGVLANSGLAVRAGSETKASTIYIHRSAYTTT